MDDYIPMQRPEFIDMEHRDMPIDRVAGAFRYSIQYNIPVNEVMFGPSHTNWYHR